MTMHAFLSRVQGNAPTRFALAALCGFVAAGCLSVPAAAQEAVSSTPPAAASAPAARRTNPREAWVAVATSLRQAERDSATAVESQLARINEFFAGRKQGARPFAEAVLGA